jgi:hypothetical protein
VLALRARAARIRADLGNRTFQAQARARKARVAVGRILEPIDPARAAQRQQIGMRKAQQRAQDSHAAIGDDRRHAGKPDRSRFAGSAHRHRLALVVGMVGEQQMDRAQPSARRNKQIAPRPASGLRHAERRLGAAPFQRFERKTEIRRAPRQRLRLRGRLRAQSVIDMQGDDAPAAIARPAI